MGDVFQVLCVFYFSCRFLHLIEDRENKDTNKLGTKMFGSDLLVMFNLLCKQSLFFQK